MKRSSVTKNIATQTWPTSPKITTHFSGGHYTTETGIREKTLPAFCRALLAAGFADAPMDVYRGQMKVLVVRSILAASLLAVREEPAPHYGKYVPFVKWEDEGED